MTSLASWAGTRVLVTGATGFIGRHLVRALAGAGADVIAVSRRAPAERHAGAAANSPGPPGLRWVQADFAEPGVAARTLEALQPDVVYHLAGHSTGSSGVEHVEPTFTSLLESSVHLLLAAHRHPVRRIVLPASLNEPFLAADEVPSSPYAAAKWATSAYARMFHSLYRVPVVLARPFMVYGPGQGAEKLVPYVTRCLLQGQPPRVSQGKWAADWTYIDDVVEGMLAAGACPAIEGRTLDLGTGETHSTREVVDLLSEMTCGRAAVQFGALEDRPIAVVRQASVEETATLIGWRARIGLREGLSRTVEWFRANIGGV